MPRLTSRLTGTYVKSLEAPLPFLVIFFYSNIELNTKHLILFPLYIKSVDEILGSLYHQNPRKSFMSHGMGGEWEEMRTIYAIKLEHTILWNTQLYQ